MFPAEIAGRDDSIASHWLDGELGNCDFRDKRLGKRFKWLAADLAGSIGDTIPTACQDWAPNTKAAYRFLSNPKVTEQDILAGHFQSTAERFLATDDAVLVLHDTTEVSYSQNNQLAVGILNHSFVRAKGGINLWVLKRFAGRLPIRKFSFGRHSYFRSSSIAFRIILIFSLHDCNRPRASKSARKAGTLSGRAANVSNKIRARRAPAG